MEIIIISIYDMGYSWSLWYGGDIIARRGYREEQYDINKLSAKDLSDVMKYLSEVLYLKEPYVTLIRCEDGDIEKSIFFNFGADCDKQILKCMDKLIKGDL